MPDAGATRPDPGTGWQWVTPTVYGPAGIVGAITAEGGLNGKDLGRIDIYDTFSTVEIAGTLSPAAFGRISAAKVSGQSLRIELDRDGDAHRFGPATRAPGSHGPRRSGPAREYRRER